MRPSDSAFDRRISPRVSSIARCCSWDGSTFFPQSKKQIPLIRTANFRAPLRSDKMLRSQIDIFCLLVKKLCVGDLECDPITSNSTGSILETKYYHLCGQSHNVPRPALFVQVSAKPGRSSFSLYPSRVGNYYWGWRIFWCRGGATRSGKFLLGWGSK